MKRFFSHVIFVVSFFCAISTSLVQGHGFGQCTQVKMAKAGQCDIKQLYDTPSSKKQYVLSYDQRIRQQAQASVSAAAEGNTNCYFKIGFDNSPDIICTPIQEFYMPETKKWVPAYKLKTGDKLLSNCITPKAITSIEFVKKSLKVYAIRIKGTHNYMVGRHNILTHNVALVIEGLVVGLGVAFGEGATAGGVAGSWLGPVGIALGATVCGVIAIGGKLLFGGDRKRIAFDAKFKAEAFENYFHNNFKHSKDGRSDKNGHEEPPKGSKRGPGDPEGPNESDGQQDSDEDESDENLRRQGLHKKERKTNSVGKKEFFEKAKSDYEHWKDGVYKRKPGRDGFGKDAEYLEWDHLHGEVETYSRLGKHTGALDPATGQWYKPPVSGRTLKNRDNMLGKNVIYEQFLQKIDASDAQLEKTLLSFDSDDYKKLPILFDLIAFHRLSALKFLYERGVSFSYKSSSGATGLHVACAIDGNLEIVKFLIENSIFTDVNTCTDEGETPFSLAVMYNHVDIVSYFLQHANPDMSVRLLTGETVCDLATKTGNAVMIKLLGCDNA